MTLVDEIARQLLISFGNTRKKCIFTILAYRLMKYYISQLVEKSETFPRARVKKAVCSRERLGQSEYFPATVRCTAA